MDRSTSENGAEKGAIGGWARLDALLKRLAAEPTARSR